MFKVNNKDTRLLNMYFPTGHEKNNMIKEYNREKVPHEYILTRLQCV